MFLVDFVVFVAFVWLALKADRFWPIGVAALQFAGFTSHIAKAASSGVIAWAYSIGQSLWGYPIILLILWGTVRHRRRLRAFGADSSWTRYSSQSAPTTPNDGRVG